MLLALHEAPKYMREDSITTGYRQKLSYRACITRYYITTYHWAILKNGVAQWYFFSIIKIEKKYDGTYNNQLIWQAFQKFYLYTYLTQILYPDITFLPSLHWYFHFTVGSPSIMRLSTYGHIWLGSSFLWHVLDILFGVPLGKYILT